MSVSCHFGNFVFGFWKGREGVKKLMIFRQRCVKDGPEEINITQEINPVEFLERPY